MRPVASSVWAVVLSFDARDLTSSCVSLLASCESLDHILVVDNGSRAGEALDRSICDDFSDKVAVTLERLPLNYGYAGGMQAGIRRAIREGADLVYLVNNDCSVADSAVVALRDAMSKEERVGAAAGPVRHHDWIDGGSRLDHMRFRNIRLPVQGDEYEVEFPPGDAWMLRAAAIDEVGGLDCRLFLLGEEPDWCFRARKAGWKTLMVPTAVVTADRGATTSRFAPEIGFYAVRNRLWLIRRQLRGRDKILALGTFMLWRGPRIALGRLMRGDLRGLWLVGRASIVGLTGDCRWSDRLDDALPSRVGRLRPIDGDTQPRE